MNDGYVNTTMEGGIATITFHHPKSNSLPGHVLRDMAKAMQQLQEQAAKLGKDLAEQLEKGQGQAAVQTLQKMIEQLKQANLSKEELQKIMDDAQKAAKPGSQYGKVGDLLKNAAQQCKAGSQSDAAQTLAEAFGVRLATRIQVRLERHEALLLGAQQVRGERPQPLALVRVE